jgi:hypothetical protein
MKKRKRKYKPYQQVKLKAFQMPDIFGNVPAEVRPKLMEEIGRKARAEFEAEYPKLLKWFETYDPIYVLSFCAFYFLTAPAGIDKEAIEGKLEFGQHHLELLQALALMAPRAKSVKTFGVEAEALQQTLRELTNNLNYAHFEIPDDLPEKDRTKRFVLAQMRNQTSVIRNLGYPEQTVRHVKSIFAGPLKRIIASQYQGVSIEHVIDALAALAAQADERLNDHIKRVRPVAIAKDFETTYRAYTQAFPDVLEDREGILDVFDRLCDRDLTRLQSFLLMQTDLRLEHIYAFSLSDIAHAYGNEEHQEGLALLMREWSYQFGDLADYDPKRFLYTNPILQRPFIRLGEDSFYWVQCGIYSHTLPGMLESLIPKVHRDEYMTRRSRYLEDQVEGQCQKAFPNGRVFRGSQYRLQGTDREIYENDILVLIDSTAIIIECKANLIDPPARRGAEYRLVDTLKNLVVSASDQAQRFSNFLKANPCLHSFPTKRGRVNNVDASRLLRFIPLSITYEYLGSLSASFKDCVEAGLIEPGHAIVPSISLSDLEVLCEILDSEVERIHYLARRGDIERTMHYSGDEMDLLAFYLDTGFNIGDWDRGEHFLQMTGKSKELDPFFVGRADGVSVPKPRLKLTDWWRDILTRIAWAKPNCWTEIACVLLSVAHQDQQKFEKSLKELIGRIRHGKVTHRHNSVTMFSGTLAVRQYAIVGFPFSGATRDERNQMMHNFAADAEVITKVHGTAVLAVSMDCLHYPYDALMFFPGHAPGALDFAPVTSKQ